MSGLTQGPSPKLVAAHGNSTAMDIVLLFTALIWEYLASSSFPSTPTVLSFRYLVVLLLTEN